MDRLASMALPRNLVAIVAVPAAILARRVVDPSLGDRIRLTTPPPSILVVAGFVGRGPSLVAVGLGAVLSARFLLPPRNPRSTSSINPDDIDSPATAMLGSGRELISADAY